MALVPNGAGGIVSHTSSASRLMMPLTSPDAYAAVMLPYRFPPGREPGAGGGSRSGAPAACRVRVARRALERAGYRIGRALEDACGLGPAEAEHVAIAR